MSMWGSQRCDRCKRICTPGLLAFVPAATASQPRWWLPPVCLPTAVVWQEVVIDRRVQPNARVTVKLDTATRHQKGPSCCSLCCPPAKFSHVCTCELLGLARCVLSLLLSSAYTRWTSFGGEQS
jgi:hypothetical protein